ncbi:MAG TPA: DUF3168 domain-containing protein [Paracoccus solventivorans]|uniref:DUF3168 domain-containing protein n=1 Tax=Paracoccus solventivorans TaxID=53463 RepID=A0A832QWW8_9RHOB|nr:DUF3168 domain-containing protein [Paracoccus solventivorans]HHW34336.1 DUF3168 domain-containing protein [Paracoccus solventivorans]
MPDLILLEGVRGALVPALAGLVEPSHIRAGGVRPDAFPAVILGLPTAEIEGRASGGQLVASLDQLLHIWVRDDDAETGHQIASAIMAALLDAPRALGGTFDSWDRPRMTWVADPANEALHGAVALGCTIRWRANQ